MIATNTNATVEVATKIPAKLDAVAVLLHKSGEPLGVDSLGKADRAAVDAIVKAKAATAKANEVVAQLADGRRVLTVGLGESEKTTAQTLREGGAALAKYARRHKLVSLALVVPDEHPNAVEMLANGFLLGSFQFREFKGSATENHDGKPRKLTLISKSKDAAALRRATILAEGQNLARTVASRPGNEINPPTLAKVARAIAKDAGLTIKVLDERELKRLGMGGLLAVGGGSPNAPRLIALEHKGAKEGPPIVVIGKSITFDTGGISIKPAEKMGDMIYDKSGGMTVLGLMHVLSRLDFPAHVVGILTSAENHVSGTAYRPGDIITQHNGVTVEITNTDAEGRLVLADAISWAIKTYKPAAVVDLATLTGGCVVALGHTMAGLMSNNDALAEELLDAAREAGEKAWRLPVGEDQREMMKSNHADIVNSAGRWASPLTGAAFLTFALGDKWESAVPWAHLDIAGVADTDKELPLYAKGATGWGVRTLFAWLSRRASVK